MPLSNPTSCFFLQWSKQPQYPALCGQTDSTTVIFYESGLLWMSGIVIFFEQVTYYQQHLFIFGWISLNKSTSFLRKLCKVCAGFSVLAVYIPYSVTVQHLSPAEFLKVESSRILWNDARSGKTLETRCDKHHKMNLTSTRSCTMKVWHWLCLLESQGCGAVNQQGNGDPSAPPFPLHCLDHRRGLDAGGE